jgi:hypothetical protein
MMYQTGLCIDLSQFSCDRVASLVDNYMANTRKLSPKHWKQIMKSCGASSEDLNPPLTTVAMQQNRRSLYILSSPAKGSDNDLE